MEFTMRRELKEKKRHFSGLTASRQARGWKTAGPAPARFAAKIPVL
jgi:hypothetical protein